MPKEFPKLFNLFSLYLEPVSQIQNFLVPYSMASSPVLQYVVSCLSVLDTVGIHAVGFHLRPHFPYPIPDSKTVKRK